MDKINKLLDDIQLLKEVNKKYIIEIKNLKKEIRKQKQATEQKQQKIDYLYQINDELKNGLVRETGRIYTNNKRNYLEQNDKFYFDRWMQAEQINKDLKKHIEKLKLRAEFNSNFKEEIKYLKKEIARNEKTILSQQRIIGNCVPLLLDLITIFDSHFLLNENIADVKLEKDTVKQIINHCRAILIKSKKEFSHTHYKVISNIHNEIK